MPSPILYYIALTLIAACPIGAALQLLKRSTRTRKLNRQAIARYQRLNDAIRGEPMKSKAAFLASTRAQREGPSHVTFRKAERLLNPQGKT